MPFGGVYLITPDEFRLRIVAILSESIWVHRWTAGLLNRPILVPAKFPCPRSIPRSLHSFRGWTRLRQRLESLVIGSSSRCSSHRWKAPETARDRRNAAVSLEKTQGFQWHPGTPGTAQITIPSHSSPTRKTPWYNPIIKPFYSPFHHDIPFFSVH